jgi:hypothetical protein
MHDSTSETLSQRSEVSTLSAADVGVEVWTV